MITAVTGFGLFVELTDIYVEGLVHVTALPGDYYHFDPVHHRLAGERTGRSFRLGDTVEVQVMRVDLDERKIDFGMPDKPAEPAGRKSVVKPQRLRPKAKRPRRKPRLSLHLPRPVVVLPPGQGPEAYRPSDAAAKTPSCARAAS